MMLTARQQEILDFIETCTLTCGYPPTVREIGARFGIRSPNGVACHLKALEKKGAIRRGPPRSSRAMKIIRPFPADDSTMPERRSVALPTGEGVSPAV